MSLPSSEAEVVLWLKRGLTAGALYGDAVSDVLVDADGSYTGSPHARGLRPFGTVRIGEWRPDLVCAQDRGGLGVQRVLAFEVKGLRDHEKGVVQAERYRHGADESYVCVPGDPSSWLLRSAERLGVGVVAATAEDVRVVAAAPVPQPEVGAREALRRRLLGERDFRAFGLNKPLHYAAAVLAHRTPDPVSALEEMWGLGRSAARMAVGGAETLGLLDRGRLTRRGQAVAEALSYAGFTLQHDRALTRRRLVEEAPAYAAVLRLVQLDIPVVSLIVEALESLGGEASIRELAERAFARDPGLAGAAFGEPPEGEAWRPRSTTVFQLKAQLYDTGVLSSRLARGAGQANQGVYSPEQDRWAL